MHDWSPSNFTIRIGTCVSSRFCVLKFHILICQSIPNIPGFYLLFRAYSHFRALYGARHLEFLVQNKLVETVPSPKLDDLYIQGFPETSTASATESIQKRLAMGEEDVMLLNKDS